MTLLLHAARGLHLAAVSFAGGGGVTASLGVRGTVPARPDRLARWVLGACVIAVLTEALLLEGHAAELLDTGAMLPPPGEAWAAVQQSWVGRLMLGEAALLGGGMLLIVAKAPLIAVSLLAAGCLALIALAGHAGAEGGSGLAAASVAHVTLAGLWFGSLPALLLTSRRGKDGRADPLPARLAVFSRLALPAMLAVLGTGAALALWTTGGQAGLFGTVYGALLLGKVTLVAAALACAARLRRGLPAVRMGLGAGPRRMLAAETAAALLVVLLAAVLAGLQPPAHADIVWPWPIRLAPATAWLITPGAASLITAGLATLVLACAIAAFAWRARRTRVLVGACVLGAFGVALALPAACVPAYATSFAHMQVPYDAATISAGAGLFAANCTACHGRTGHGDGVAAAGMMPRPADLTAPHLGYHTHGELFWWIGHGYPGSAMPGFAPLLDATRLWQVVAYLMALSQGHQARVLPSAPVPDAPWLPEIDFPIGGARTLADLRGAPVVLVFLHGRPAAEAGWLAPVARMAASAHARMLAVLPKGTEAPAGIDAVRDAEGSIWTAWSNDRRTLAHPGFDDRDPPPSLLGFLIDRFGFVRARWRSDEPDDMPDAASLRASIEAVRAEPHIEDPDAHGV